MVTFQLNKSLDKELASAFLGSATGGIDFGESVWKYHPPLKSINGNEDELISEYFDDFYKKSLQSLEDSRTKIESSWLSIESQFLKEIDKVFNGFQFPQGKYIAYISSFDCNPRFLEDKTFQVFYLKMNSNSSIAHELTHFIFYSYCEEKLTKETKGLNPNEGKLWKVAEVFNNIILSQPNFKKILESEGDFVYPNNQELFEKSQSLYKTGKNVDIFIRDLLKSE